MGRRKPLPAAPKVQSLRETARRIIARTTPRKEVWEEEVPEVAHVGKGNVDDVRSALAQAMAVIGEGPARAALDVALQAVGRLAVDIDEQYGPLIALQDHANALQNAAQGLVASAEEADEIRDAIERYQGTAPHAWEDALHVIRTGGNLRDMWCVGRRS